MNTMVLVTMTYKQQYFYKWLHYFIKHSYLSKLSPLPFIYLPNDMCRKEMTSVVECLVSVPSTKITKWLSKGSLFYPCIQLTLGHVPEHLWENMVSPWTTCPRHIHFLSKVYLLYCVHSILCYTLPVCDVWPSDFIPNTTQIPGTWNWSRSALQLDCIYSFVSRHICLSHCSQ